MGVRQASEKTGLLAPSAALGTKPQPAALPRTLSELEDEIGQQLALLQVQLEIKQSQLSELATEQKKHSSWFGSALNRLGTKLAEASFGLPAVKSLNAEESDYDKASISLLRQTGKRISDTQKKLITLLEEREARSSGSTKELRQMLESLVFVDSISAKLSLARKLMEQSKTGSANLSPEAVSLAREISAELELFAKDPEQLELVKKHKAILGKAISGGQTTSDETRSLLSFAEKNVCAADILLGSAECRKLLAYLKDESTFRANDFTNFYAHEFWPFVGTIAGGVALTSLTGGCFLAGLLAMSVGGLLASEGIRELHFHLNGRNKDGRHSSRSLLLAYAEDTRIGGEEIALSQLLGSYAEQIIMNAAGSAATQVAAKPATILLGYGLNKFASSSFAKLALPGISKLSNNYLNRLAAEETKQITLSSASEISSRHSLWGLLKEIWEELLQESQEEILGQVISQTSQALRAVESENSENSKGILDKALSFVSPEAVLVLAIEGAGRRAGKFRHSANYQALMQEVGNTLFPAGDAPDFKALASGSFIPKEIHSELLGLPSFSSAQALARDLLRDSELSTAELSGQVVSYRGKDLDGISVIYNFWSKADWQAFNKLVTDKPLKALFLLPQTEREPCVINLEWDAKEDKIQRLRSFFEEQEHARRAGNIAEAKDEFTVQLATEKRLAASGIPESELRTPAQIREHIRRSYFRGILAHSSAATTLRPEVLASQGMLSAGTEIEQDAPIARSLAKTHFAAYLKEASSPAEHITGKRNGNDENPSQRDDLIESVHSSLASALVQDGDNPAGKKQAEPLADGLYTARFKSALSEYADELFTQLELLTLSTDNSNTLHAVCNRLVENYFSSSPCLISQGDLLANIELTARVGRNPVLWRYFGPSLNGDLVYNLNFLSGQESYVDLGNALIERVLNAPPGAALDLIRQVESLLLGSGSSGPWAENAENFLGFITREIQERHPNSFVRYAAELAVARQEELSENCTISEIDNRRTVKLHFRHPLSNSQARQVAENAFADFSRGLPSVIAVINPQSLRSGDPERLWRLEQALDLARSDSMTLLDLESMALFLSAELGGITPENLKAQAAFLETIPLSYTQQEWELLLRHIKDLKTIEARHRGIEQEVLAEAQQSFLPETASFIDEVSRLATRLLSVSLNSSSTQRVALGQLLENLKSARAANDIPNSLDTAKQILSLVILESEFRNPSADFRAVVSELRTAEETYRRAEERIRAEADKRYRIKQAAALLEDEQWERDKQSEILAVDNLLKNLGLFTPEIIELLKNEIKAEQKSWLTVEGGSYQEKLLRPEISPYPEQASTEMSLLLQHLHRADLSAAIEADFQISLISLDLRSQVHFLNYLGNCTTQELAECRDVIRGFQGDKTVILKAFLANAEERQYAQAILTLARKLPAGMLSPVLQKYNDLTAATEQIEAELQQVFKASASAERIHSTTRQLLSRANRFLKSRAERNDWSPTETELTSELEHVRTSVFLFASIFRTLSEERRQSAKQLSLEEMDTLIRQLESVELKSSNAGELSEDERQQMLVNVSRGTEELENQAYRKILLDSFSQILQSPEARFHLLKYKGNIINQIYFTPQLDLEGQKYLYSGGFYAAEGSLGSHLGAPFFALTNALEGAELPIVGSLREDNRYQSAHRKLESGFENYDSEPYLFSSSAEGNVWIRRIWRKPESPESRDKKNRPNLATPEPIRS